MFFSKKFLSHSTMLNCNLFNIGLFYFITRDIIFQKRKYFLPFPPGATKSLQAADFCFEIQKFSNNFVN